MNLHEQPQTQESEETLLRYLKGEPLDKSEYDLVFPLTSPTPKGHCPKLLKTAAYTKIRERTNAGNATPLAAQILTQHLQNLDQTIGLFYEAILIVLSSSTKRRERDGLALIGQALGYVLFKFEGESVARINPQIYYAFRNDKRYEEIFSASAAKREAFANRRTKPAAKEESAPRIEEPQKTGLLSTTVQTPQPVELEAGKTKKASHIPIRQLAAMSPEAVAKIIAEERGYALQEYIEELTAEQRAAYALTNRVTMATAMVHNLEYHAPETLVKCAQENPSDAIHILNFGFGEPLRAVLKNAPPDTINQRVIQVVNKRAKKRPVPRAQTPRNTFLPNKGKQFINNLPRYTPDSGARLSLTC